MAKDDILKEDIDNEIFEELPEWFKRLKRRYKELGLDKGK